MANTKKKWFYKFWNNNEKIFIVSELIEVDHTKQAKFITSGLGLGYLNAKPLSVEESINILRRNRYEPRNYNRN